MDKQLGIRVEGMSTNEDGTTLGWEEFIEKIESVGLLYGGESRWADAETGDYVNGIENSIRENVKEKKVEEVKPIVRALKVKKSDWAIIKEAESEGLMVSMNGIVEPVRTELNKELSRYFRELEPKFTGTYDENSKVDSESVLHYINEYLEEKGINKYLEFPISSGSNMYLVPVTENLEIKVHVADEYHGGGDSETYIMIDKFKITEECTTGDVVRLVEFVNKYLK